MEASYKKRRLDTDLESVALNSFDLLPIDLLAHTCSFLNGCEHKTIAYNINRAFRQASIRRNSWSGYARVNWQHAFTREEWKKGIAVSDVMNRILSLITSWHQWVNVFISIFAYH